jgi:hypothetical protein
MLFPLLVSLSCAISYLIIVLTVLLSSVTTGWRWACRKNAFCTSREEIRLWPKAGAIFDTKWFAAVLHLFCSVSVDSSKSKFTTAPLFWRSHDGTGSWDRVSYCSIPSTFPAVGLHGKCCQGLTLCFTTAIYGSNTTYYSITCKCADIMIFFFFSECCCCYINLNSHTNLQGICERRKYWRCYC